MEEKKIGCYICSGCGLGDGLDIAGLEKVASKEQKIPVVRTHPLLCGPEGVALIRQDMQENGVNALVIAACSPRVHVDTFRFGTPLLERANLREQVLWVQPGTDKDAKEDRQMMASDYVRMSCVRVKRMNAPEPFQDAGFSKTVLVVGGGLAGLTAAQNVSRAGYQAILVEKSPVLGGKLNQMHKISPTKAPYQDPEANFIGDLVSSVEGDGNIKIYKDAWVRRTSGAPGLFDVTINQGGTSHEERVGSIVVTTGFELYDANKLGDLGYGQCKDVVTAMEFEVMAKNGQLTRPSDGKPAKKVAFSLCAGQRDAKHLEYCSGACCTYSLKQSMYVHEQFGQEAETTILFQEMRTPGQMEEFYRSAQRSGSVIVKADVKKVEGKSGGGVKVAFHDKLVRSDENLDVDLLVLPTGMVPNVDVQDPNVPSPVGQDMESEAAKRVLNLDYRQGPSLPGLKWGFPDSHFICFPYETRRTGIYVAGPARRPMGIKDTMEDASGAALKAIQVVEAVARGSAVHPRVGDLSFPSFRQEGCTQCKRCTEECPFGAINEDAKGNPQFNPTRCRRCGTCMGACPAKVISFANYSVSMIGSMLKEVEIPPADDEKPRILIFSCENDAYPALDMVGFNRSAISPYVRVIPLRCMGSMSLEWIADAMSTGFDGIMLMGCKHGDDYQCHNVRGSALAEIRLSKVSETLNRLQLESTRVRMVEVNILDADRLPGVIQSFADDLSKLDPNPYKEF
ncbi:MAG: hydrogenase iron-sulfur subunit [Magnetococcales bacterium]|nr:hydrogenase iron-sulfur subunit [Magnetococcales bacterium]